VGGFDRNQQLMQARLALADLKAENTPVVDLSTADIRRLISTTTSPKAKFGALSRFLDWCQDEGHIEINPCMLISKARRPKAYRSRAHYLTVPQLARLWVAAAELAEPVWRDLVRFLAAVPCRRGEATRLEWCDLDLDKAEWRQPDQLTKNGDPHRLHLHPLALGVLHERRAATDGKGLVFPAPVSGRSIDTFSDIKTALEKATADKQGNGLIGWVWHDFRRSFATSLGEASFPEAVVDSVLNHRQAATRSGVMGVYQRAVRWPEQIEAMKLWGEMLEESVRAHGG
jgi:integrase